jgi:hypothetical protein
MRPVGSQNASGKGIVMVEDAVTASTHGTTVGEERNMQDMLIPNTSLKVCSLVVWRFGKNMGNLC